MQLPLWLMFSVAALGEGLVPVRSGASCGDDADDCPPEPSGWSAANETATTVATVMDIISLLELSSSSLNKGVMVVAANWSDAHGQFPYAFLRTLHQARHKQPVYTADVKHLLADGRRANSGDGGPGGAATAVADDGSPVAPPCRRPAAADYPHSFLLPPRCRYAVLFSGSDAAGAAAGAARDPFAELAALKYTFFDANVYYLIVVPEFDAVLRQTILDAWTNLSIYKYVTDNGHFWTVCNFTILLPSYLKK